MKIDFKNQYKSGTIITFAYDNKVLSKDAAAFDKKTNGSIKKSIEQSKFDGKFGEIVSILCPAGLSASRLICIGLGNKKDLSTSSFEKMGAMIAKTILTTKETEINIFADDLIKISSAHLGFGMLLASYKFDKFKSDSPKTYLAKATIITKSTTEARKEFNHLSAIASGIFTTRDLISEPPNVLTTEEFAKRTKTLMDGLGAKTEIITDTKLKQKKMNLIMAVGGASVNRPRMAVIKYLGGKKNDAPIALVGKGLCFDSGGLSLKPGAGMVTMKQDMAGGATVVGVIQSLALQKAPVNVIGIIPMVENSVAGNSYRVDDVIASYSGKTVEVKNTDAEGRLVLADALWYAQEFNPSAIIDLATLTGAIKVALGEEYAGLFSNNDQLATKLCKHGAATGDKVWRFPMDKAYDDMIKSDIADMKNIGGPSAGSITAACFLQRFIKPDVKWAHLDIAGTAFVEKKTNPKNPVSATGFGVYLLNSFILDKTVK